MSAPPPAILQPAPALRLLRAGESPYPGWLQADDPQTVWVDLALVPEDLWHREDGENLLVPIDLARTADGHAAVLPHCPQRLIDAVPGAGAGASVTIAVSVLRAAAAARRLGIVTGQWWVDAAGRPVLAEVGDQAWADAADTIVGELAAAATGALRTALESLRAMLALPRWRADAQEECEDRLFAAAEPRPLAVRGPESWPFETAPRRADSLQRDDGAPHAELAATRGRWLDAVMDAEWGERIAAAVAEIAAAPRRAAGWMRERAHRRSTSARGGTGPDARRDAAPDARRDVADRTRRSRRGAPLLLAAAVASLVLGVGLWWPDSAAPDAVPAGAETPDQVSEAAAPATPTSPATADAAAVPAGDDLEAAAEAALRALAACAADAAACADVMENPAAPAPTGVVTAGADAVVVTLLDEYGGIAVFRVEAQERPAQILVLVGADGEWLVRDVYDVADQP